MKRIGCEELQLSVLALAAQHGGKVVHASFGHKSVMMNKSHNVEMPAAVISNEYW